MHRKALLLTCLLTLPALLGVSGDSSPAAPAPSEPGQVFSLTYMAAPADNPLKGFVPYAGTHSFPHSMEWFYIPLKDIQTDYNRFDWRKFDSQLDAIAARGHQAVFRIYLDYPDHAYGVPDFLSGVAKNAYTDNGNGKKATSYSPDYNDPKLQRAILSCIAALGARYDKDPRIAFITAGILGFWGEWHSYPHQDWNGSPAFMKQILDAYEHAFPNTLILAREPKSGVPMKRPRLGFHDDSFAYTTLAPTPWHFWPKVTAAGLQDCWQTAPIGGEIRPEVQGHIWDETPGTPAGQGYDLCVATTHASWMMAHGAFSNRMEPEQRQRAIAGAQSLGYSLFVSTASVDALTSTQALKGSVTLDNRGVAPFYYPWTVQMAALDAAGKLTAWPIEGDLRTVLPATPRTWAFQIPKHGLAPGSYTLLIGVMNPLRGGHPLKFANSTQDQHLQGWLSVGSFTVKIP